MTDIKSIIPAVALMKTVDLSIARMAFPVEYVHNTQKVEFDFYEGTDEIALKGNFAKQSNVVDKDGYKTITVNPMQVNESNVDAVINFSKKRIGETEYGDTTGGLSDAEKAEIEDDAGKFGKLKKRSQRLEKKSMYDVLTTGKIVVSGAGDATDEIDYGMTNIIVNDNSTAGSYQWNDTTNSFPVEQLETEARDMEYPVDTYVLGFEAQKAWSKHPQVRTTDNTTTGKRANFTPATKEERASKSTKYMKYLGSTTGDTGGTALEIYYEMEKYNSNSSFYLDKNYVVGFTMGDAQNGQRQYGAIPVAEGMNTNSDLVAFVGKEWIDAEVFKDPAGVKRYYRSSPLPTMNVPKAFISIKATLI